MSYAAYITRDEADTLLAAMLVSGDARRVAFDALSDPDKDVLLTQASDQHDAVPWDGRVEDEDQDRLFPRVDHLTGVRIDPDPAETGAEPHLGVPHRLRRSVAVQAAHNAALARGLGAARELEESASRGVTSVSMSGRGFALDLRRANTAWAALCVDSQKLMARYRATSAEGA